MKEYDRATELFMEAIPVKEELGDVEALTRCYLGLAAISYDHARLQHGQSEWPTRHWQLQLRLNPWSTCTPDMV